MKTPSKKTFIRSIIFGSIVLAIVSLFVWIAAYIGVFEIPDSYFYVTLGQYFYTGELVPINPYNFDKPQLLFGPIYGVLLYPLLIQKPPVGMFFIPLFQLLLILLNASIIFYLIKKRFGYKWGISAFLLYIFFPFNIIYGTFLMSEVLTQTWVSLYALVFHMYQRGARRPFWAGLLIFIGAFATLTRYVYGLLFGFGILLLLWTIIWKKSPKHSLKRLSKLRIRSLVSPKTLLPLFPAIAGMLIIFRWMAFHHQVNGTWALTTFTGRHIYNNVVLTARLLPPRDHPTMDMFTKVFPEKFPTEEQIFRPWWWLQLAFNDGIIPETTVDRWMRDVSIAAVLHHPLAYTRHLLGMMVIEPTTAPYYPDDIIESLKNSCTEGEMTGSCRVPWNTHMCRPARTSCAVLGTWSSYLQANINFYPVGSAILFFLALVGTVISMIKRQKTFMGIAFLFITIHTVQSATEWVEGRFLIPLYPLYAMMVIVGIHSMITGAKNILVQFSRSLDDEH